MMDDLLYFLHYDVRDGLFHQGDEDWYLKLNYEVNNNLSITVPVGFKIPTTLYFSSEWTLPHQQDHAL